MIRNTFSILNGIGSRIEKRLWSSGIRNWEQFIDAPHIDFIASERKTGYDLQLKTASEALQRKDPFYFASTIRRREHWRLFDSFKNEAVCLDIETNGFMPENGGYATLVGLFDGYDYQSFIHGENLTADNLSKALSGYKYLITFFGSGFDVPFLMRAMPELPFSIPHYDLCFAARSLRFKGGLKKLETELGIARDESVKGMNGYDAVRLWEEARQGSAEALALLKMYNREDTVNLMKIAEIVYEQLRTATGIKQHL